MVGNLGEGIEAVFGQDDLATRLDEKDFGAAADRGADRRYSRGLATAGGGGLSGGVVGAGVSDFCEEIAPEFSKTPVPGCPDAQKVCKEQPLAFVLFPR